MLKRPIWIFATIAGAALCAAVQLRVNYRDEDFTLSGFDKFSATLEANSVEFQGSGGPLHIETRSSGLDIWGKEAEGTAVRNPDRSYFLKNLTISGGTHAVVDSGATAKNGATADRTLTDVLSETMNFTGTASTGRLDFPSEATIDSKTTGVRPTKDKASAPFERTLHLTGSKGFVTLLLGGKESGGLQAGELNGPVTFTLRQTTGEGSAAPTTTIEGTGDKLTFSVGAEPRTVTLEGNVKATGKSDVFTGDLTADSMVVTLGADLQPAKVDIKGNPAKTHATGTGGNGGSR